ncbi:Ldh family oxidoreductase [Ramlibacter tataouinensis]|uniref:Malate dehydrogenase-like protein n=1 Tax=Ramlibacter tataouinensis (strain ATCC BAA-407 / DSM 14655 / LMG 21543 / TTB310) TaxID=365046 RepID=F5Y1T2_RAMTT|nr:Ldh family oxidoreductase [Ramlibacter tataouinensis]AEG92333.1 malate dehydrogenase-like protein [Ramlibacter tataouinensis TTB310]
MSTEDPAKPVAPERLRDFVARVYRSAGVPEADAAFVADTLVQADLWGHQSHGVLRLGWYYARLRSGAMRPVTAPQTVVDAGAVAVIDGKDGVGQVIARHATEEAVRRARLHGVGVVSVRNSNHFGTCMYFTGMGAKAGCITLLTTNGGPNMAPWGGVKKMIGTNPWSVGAPAGRHAPMIMDVANSGVARGKIFLAQQRREPIPDGWAIDKDGAPTTDPRAALEGFILPMAGHKGYAIGVIVDMLSGVLSGSAFLDDVHGPYDPVNRSGAGHFFAAFNLEAFQPRAQFDARMEEYIARLKAVPVAPGHAEVYYPGELEARNEARHRREGLVLPADTLADLDRVAHLAGIGDYRLRD